MKSRHEDKDTIVHNAGNVLENHGCPSARANICLSIHAKLWGGGGAQQDRSGVQTLRPEKVSVCTIC